MATIKEPTLSRDGGNVRRPNGKAPGGPLRGGPERSARDPQTPKKPIQRENNGEVPGEKRKATWPVIVTVDGEGNEKKMGTSLAKRRVESGTLLGEPERSGEGLPRKGRHTEGSRHRKTRR